MRTSRRHRPVRHSLLAALALLLLLPATAAAHAELDQASPADGDTVEGTPAVIEATFTEALADGSSLQLVNAGGTVVAEATVDPDDPERMAVEPEELEPGTYEVRWQALAEDGHIERGTYSFTVTAAPTASPAPSRTEEPTTATSPSPPASTPAPSPTPTAAPAGPEPAATTTDVLIPIVVAIVLLAVLAGYLLNRRRTTLPR